MAGSHLCVSIAVTGSIGITAAVQLQVACDVAARTGSEPHADHVGTCSVSFFAKCSADLFLQGMLLKLMTEDCVGSPGRHA